MKTVSMGTSAREGEGRAAAVTRACLTTSVTRGDLSLSPRRDGMEPVFHTHIHADVHGVGRRGLSGGGMEGGDKCMYVRTAGRACLGGVAEEEHLTRHCQGTHE